MSGHLLLVSLGPVQDFIVQARRTRDLWFGSHLLAEVSRAAAKALAEGGALLIFPALAKGSQELEPRNGPFAADGKPSVSVANKILAEAPAGGVTPRELAMMARKAAHARLAEAAGQVKQECGGLLAPGVEAAWDEQIDTLLEFNAAWGPLGDGDGAYKDARGRVEATLGGRKLLRDFPVWSRQRGHVPKSSLDGARDTVLAEPEDRADDLVRKYRIPDGEHLDAVGLLKRAGGKPGQFVPLANVALAAWLSEARKHLASRPARQPRADGQTELTALLEACVALDGQGRVDSKVPWVRDFPYDAQVLLPDRWASLFKDSRLGGDSPAKAAKGWGEAHVMPLLQAVKGHLEPPYPYVACLVADGDHIGLALDQLPKPEDHRFFSRRLAKFAAQARAIVEVDHRGSLVYAGGDDVLAFVALPDALSCADALRKAFRGTMSAEPKGQPEDAQSGDMIVETPGSSGGAASEPPTMPGWPTLSVGIGVGHMLESMGDLLELGRQAEKLAKQSRNALAVVVDKRSGGVVSWSATWDGPGGDPATRLAADRKLLETTLSTKKVYEVRRDSDRLPSHDEVRRLDPPEAAAWSALLAADIARTLARTGEGDGVTPAQVGLDLTAQSYDLRKGSVDSWVDRMLVARVFAEAEPVGTRQREVAGV